LTGEKLKRIFWGKKRREVGFFFLWARDFGGAAVGMARKRGKKIDWHHIADSGESSVAAGFPSDY